jgi:galactokinase
MTVDTLFVSKKANGRINLMGRHIDHQGGYYNMTLIDNYVQCDVYKTISTSTKITLTSCDDQHKYLCDVDEIGLKDNWSKYVIAPLIYLNNKYGLSDKINKHTYHINIWGNIPQGAGLSSSSALVVACTKCFIELFNIENINNFILINDCCNAEKLIGTGGGSGDHASIILGKPHIITKIKMLPNIVIENTVNKPENLEIYIYDSGVKATKGTGTCNQLFNNKVKCYDIGFRCLNKETYLKDLSEESLTTIRKLNNETVINVMKYGYREYNRSNNFYLMCLNNDYEGIGKMVKQSMLDEQVLYKCSCNEIDIMVKMANNIDGVLGAQICGAGMGGCLAIFTLKGTNVKNVFKKYDLVAIV